MTTTERAMAADELAKALRDLLACIDNNPGAKPWPWHKGQAMEALARYEASKQSEKPDTAQDVVTNAMQEIFIAKLLDGMTLAQWCRHVTNATFPNDVRAALEAVAPLLAKSEPCAAQAAPAEQAMPTITKTRNQWFKLSDGVYTVSLGTADIETLLAAKEGDIFRLARDGKALQAANAGPLERVVSLRAHKMIADAHHDLIVAMQAAVIEWQHGAGAEQAMEWIANTLDGPGLLPDPDEPYGKEAQAYWDANNANPMGPCAVCGRPSNQAGAGVVVCSHEHYKEAVTKANA